MLCIINNIIYLYTHKRTWWHLHTVLREKTKKHLFRSHDHPYGRRLQPRLHGCLWHCVGCQAWVLVWVGNRPPKKAGWMWPNRSSTQIFIVWYIYKHNVLVKAWVNCSVFGGCSSFQGLHAHCEGSHYDHTTSTMSWSCHKWFHI